MILRFREFYPNHIDVSRHWCPRSQSYAGVDALLSYLESGWKIQGDISTDHHQFGEARRVTVYYFILTKMDKRITMPVLHNPVLDRLLTRLCQKEGSDVRIVDQLRIGAAEP